MLGENKACLLAGINICQFSNSLHLPLSFYNLSSKPEKLKVKIGQKISPRFSLTSEQVKVRECVIETCLLMATIRQFSFPLDLPVILQSGHLTREFDLKAPEQAGLQTHISWTKMDCLKWKCLRHPSTQHFPGLCFDIHINLVIDYMLKY